MKYFVVEVDSGRVRYEADIYEDAFFRMCSFQRLLAEDGRYAELEIINAEDYYYSREKNESAISSLQ